MPCALLIESLSKVYFNNGIVFHAVNAVNLVAQSGQIIGLLGPNGAGKTTIIKMLCGLITPTHGSLYLNGYHVINQRSQAMLQIGVVLEGARNIYWQLSAWNNLWYYGKLKGCHSHQLRERATMLLQELGIWDRRHTPVGEFSRGMQQKIAIACALVSNPPIMLLDEPILGLDSESTRMIQSWITKLAQCEGKTIILSTQQLITAQELCTHIALINQGQLVALQPTASLPAILKKNENISMLEDLYRL